MWSCICAQVTNHSCVRMRWNTEAHCSGPRKQMGACGQLLGNYVIPKAVVKSPFLKYLNWWDSEKLLRMANSPAKDQTSLLSSPFPCYWSMSNSRESNFERPVYTSRITILVRKWISVSHLKLSCQSCGHNICKFARPWTLWRLFCFYTCFVKLDINGVDTFFY